MTVNNEYSQEISFQRESNASDNPCYKALLHYSFRLAIKSHVPHDTLPWCKAGHHQCFTIIIGALFIKSNQIKCLINIIRLRFRYDFDSCFEN